MNFPYTPKHLLHRSGAKILSINSLTHECHPPREGYSQDIWCANCTVEWSDTKKVSDASVQVGNICYADDGGGHAEYVEFSKAVSDYLAEHGEFHRDGGKHQGWYAHRKERSAA